MNLWDILILALVAAALGLALRRLLPRRHTGGCGCGCEGCSGACSRSDGKCP